MNNYQSNWCSIILYCYTLLYWTEKSIIYPLQLALVNAILVCRIYKSAAIEGKDSSKILVVYIHIESRLSMQYVSTNILQDLFLAFFIFYVKL